MSQPPSSLSSSRNTSSSDSRNDIHPQSTPGSSLTSSSPSSSGSSQRPVVDSRSQYKGFKFVFATDAYHERRHVYGAETGSSIKYIKPIHEGQTIDHLPPLRLPYFFTGFAWKDIGGQERVISRGSLCNAWQIAFNRLIYYASFQEDGEAPVSDEDKAWSKQEFTKWNDWFCELDATLDKLATCEQAHIVPHFEPTIGLIALTESDNLTNAETPLEHLSCTFLCAAIEVKEKDMEQHRRKEEDVREVEKGKEGWEPCTGYSVVQASVWNSDRGSDGADGVEQRHGTADSTANPGGSS